MMKRLLGISLFALGLATHAQAQSAVQGAIQGLAEQVGDTDHIEFKGSSNWDYQLNRISNEKLQMTIPAVDDATKVKLQTWSTRKIKKIEVAPGEIAGTSQITFTLAGANIESFDYLTDEPSRLIVDIYPKAEMKPVLVQEGHATQKPAPVAKKLATELPKKVAKNAAPAKAGDYAKKGTGGRTPASDELLQVDPEGEEQGSEPVDLERGIFDAGDPNYKRFSIRDYEIKEDSIIASRQNIYLPFPILKLKTSLIEDFKKAAAEYEIKEKDTKENKEARLLLTLFKSGRDGLFLKTYDFFSKAYPESEYDEIVKHMAAEVYERQWEKTKNQPDYLSAKDLYTYLIEKYPNSIMHERTSLLVGFRELERRNGLETIQRFQDFLAKNKDSKYRDWAKRALAEGYIMLGKYEDALATYEDLEKNYVDKKSSAEAAYRRGDVYFERKDYAQAVDAYNAAIKKYPDGQNVYPNAHFNLAESLFWLGKYKESLDHELSYVRLFPAHDYGGYALTRIGELLDILGADKSRSMGAFLESTFRFQNSNGANIARIRMISQQMMSMKDKELRKVLDEMDKITKVTKLPKIEEFVTLMAAEGFRRRNEYDQAIDRLVAFYQKNPTTTNLNFFSQRIRQNITDLIKQKVDASDFIAALELNNKYAKTWLMHSERMDIPYLIGQAYEQAGVYKDAGQIYLETRLKMEKLTGTTELRERRVNEYLPNASELQLRLASVELNERNYAAAFDDLQKTKNDELKPKQQVERVELAAQLHEQRGDRTKAIQALEALEKSWKDKKELLLPIRYRLAKLYFDEKKFVETDKVLQKIASLEAPTDTKGEDTYMKALRLKGDSLMEQSQPVAAVEAYLDLLNKFEKKFPLQNVRFQAGRILYNKGDVNGAEKIWGALDGDKGKVYKRMAQEKLDDIQWQNEYSKYIDRIPAAANLKKK